MNISQSNLALQRVTDTVLYLREGPTPPPPEKMEDNYDICHGGALIFILKITWKGSKQCF